MKPRSRAYKEDSGAHDGNDGRHTLAEGIAQRRGFAQVPGKKERQQPQGSAIPADAFESSALRSVNATPTAARQKRIVDAE